MAAPVRAQPAKASQRRFQRSLTRPKSGWATAMITLFTLITAAAEV